MWLISFKSLPFPRSDAVIWNPWVLWNFLCLWLHSFSAFVKAEEVDGVFIKLAFVDRDLMAVFFENRNNFPEISVVLFLRFGKKNKYIVDMYEDATHIHKYIVHRFLECRLPFQMALSVWVFQYLPYSWESGDKPVRDQSLKIWFFLEFRSSAVNIWNRICQILSAA